LFFSLSVENKGLFYGFYNTLLYFDLKYLKISAKLLSF